MNYQFDDDGKIIIVPKTSIKLKPYVAREPTPYELMTDEELLNGIGGTFVVDSEFYVNYVLIAFRDVKTNKVVEFEIDSDIGECFNERKLSWILHNYTTVGFNSIKFDIPLIWMAYKYQNSTYLKEAVNDLIFGNLWYLEVPKKYNFQIFQTAHIDLIEVCPLRGSLKLYGARLHSKRIQELPIDHNKVLTNEEKIIVKDYCINSDLPATMLLFNNLEEQLKLRTELTKEYKIDLMSKSDAQIAEAVIGKELQKLTGKWPKKPDIQSSTIHKFNVPQNMFFQTEHMQKVLTVIQNADFGLDGNGRLIAPEEIRNLNIPLDHNIYRMGIGGLHSSEKNISAVSNEEYEILDRDVASYYPAIVLNLGLYPHHLGEDFLKVYRSLVERRLAAKKAKNIAVSENLKVTINGTFGKTGSPYSILYAPEMTIAITVGGQLYLLMLIEALELAGIPVYSTNTDGIVIYCPRSKKEQYLEIIKVWEQITGFVTEETKYEAIYSRDVNAYIAVKQGKGNILETKGKNDYYDPWNGKSAKDKYWRFQKNPQGQICVEAIELLLTENKPIEQTIKECTDITKFISIRNVNGGAHKDGMYLGKTIRWYHTKNELGTINYIISGNKVPDSDGAKPLMDLPEEFPNDINYQYYIDKTTELLYDMNYLKRAKQLRFF